MFRILFTLLWVLGLTLTANASDVVYAGGGTMAQIVDGGGVVTTINLVNLDAVAASYTLNFYDDNGNPLNLSTTAGSGTSLSGQLPIGGSIVIRTNGGGPNTQGYAVLVTNNIMAGSAIFGLPLSNLPVIAEASCPMDTGLDSIVAVPFDQTTAVTGIAIANSFGDAAFQTGGIGVANIAVAIYDQTGATILTDTIQMNPGTHTAFLLASRYQQTSGKQGVMVLTATDNSPSHNPYVIKTIALRVNLAGTAFTSIIPIVPCNSNGSECTN